MFSVKSFVMQILMNIVRKMLLTLFLCAHCSWPYLAAVRLLLTPNFRPSSSNLPLHLRLKLPPNPRPLPPFLRSSSPSPDSSLPCPVLPRALPPVPIPWVQRKMERTCSLQSGRNARQRNTRALLTRRSTSTKKGSINTNRKISVHCNNLSPVLFVSTLSYISYFLLSVLSSLNALLLSTLTTSSNVVG